MAPRAHHRTRLDPSDLYVLAPFQGLTITRELQPNGLHPNQLTEDRQIDPQRVITDIGLDELSLKKRHRLYVTLMTDLSDPTRPQILAVERGRDTTAALKCLDRLTQEQRQQVRTHRVNMGPAYPAACRPEVAPQPCRDGSVPCG